MLGKMGLEHHEDILSIMTESTDHALGILYDAGLAMGQTEAYEAVELYLNRVLDDHTATTSYPAH